MTNTDEAEEKEGEKKDEQSDSPTSPEKVNLIFNKAVNCRKLFVFVQKLIAGVATAHAEMGLKLYLECALVAENCATMNVRGGNHSSSSCDFNGMAYEFIAQAFILYEDEISDSKIQYRSIVSMVGTLLSCRSFAKEDYESLITKTTQYGAKLLRKPDQCKMIIMCSHLFYRNEKDVSAACLMNMKFLPYKSFF
uniref:Uncharacterized protein n=1 Tax=Leptocylindrus danicus TaxID=163516 RepID=A0A7S2LDA2_9STRA